MFSRRQGSYNYLHIKVSVVRKARNVPTSCKNMTSKLVNTFLKVCRRTSSASFISFFVGIILCGNFVTLSTCITWFSFVGSLFTALKERETRVETLVCAIHLLSPVILKLQLDPAISNSVTSNSHGYFKLKNHFPRICL